MSKDAADAIRGMIDRYLLAYADKNAKACAMAYSEDAMILSPWASPAIGRAAVQAPHDSWFEEDEQNKSMVIKRLTHGGDLAVCVLHYSADVRSEDGGMQRMHGVSLNSLSKGPDGTWTFTCTSLNELEDEGAFAQ